MNKIISLDGMTFHSLYIKFWNYFVGSNLCWNGI